LFRQENKTEKLCFVCPLLLEFGEKRLFSVIPAQVGIKNILKIY
jgi:hypothetical protein